MKTTSNSPRIRARRRPIQPVVKADAANPAASAITARYAYDGFGKEIAVSGVDAEKNAFRFSTKQLDVETGMNYYGYRFYTADAGRWINRDPIVEKGGWNIYEFSHNNPINRVDFDGRIAPAIPIAGGIIAAVMACGLPQHKAAFEKFPDSGDKFKHCWVSCRISKTCGQGISQLAGLGKEARDRAVAGYCSVFPDSDICKGGQGDFWDSIADLNANQQCMGWESNLGPIGGWIGAICRKSCEDCCKEKVGYKNGQP